MSRLFFSILIFAVAFLCWQDMLWAGRLPKLRYDVKLGPIRMGHAEIEDLGEEEHPDLGRVRHLRVKVHTSQFKDLEDIYADPNHFVPLRVDRDLVYLGRHEKIVEYYGQDKGQIRVVKEGDGEKFLHRDPPVQNVFLVILKAFELGVESVGERINLPTSSYRLIVRNGRRIKTKQGLFSTYRIATDPRKISIWIDKEKGIPVRISGAVPILPYVLSLTKIEG